MRAQDRLGQGGVPDLPATPPPTPARATATAIGRAADRLYQLPVRTLSVQPGALTLAELPELLPDLPMVVVLQGPGDLLGAIALCPQAVAALVEWQALGQVTSRGLERRRPTRSDGLLCAEFINTLMADLATEMAGVEGFDAMPAYRFLTHLDDPRPLSLMLEDRSFRSLSCHLAMGAPDTRDGRILIVLPQPAAPARDPAGTPPLHPAAPPPPPVVVSATLAARMQDAPIVLTAVLCRKRISLAELRGVMAGRLLALPRSCLTQATLETASGQVLATGKFGEAEGCHALRLHDPDPTSAAAPVVPVDVTAGLDAMDDHAAVDPFRAQTTTAPRAPGTELVTRRG